MGGQRTAGRGARHIGKFVVWGGGGGLGGECCARTLQDGVPSKCVLGGQCCAKGRARACKEGRKASWGLGGGQCEGGSGTCRDACKVSDGG